MKRKEKEDLVNQYTKLISQAEFILFYSFQGIEVAEITLIRQQLAKQSTRLKVINNNLLVLIFDKLGYSKDQFDSFITGPTGLVISNSKKMVDVLKKLLEIQNKSAVFKLSGGIIDNKKVGLSDIQAISKLPSKEELIVKLMAILKTPILKVALLQKAPMTKLMVVLNQVKEKKAA